LGTIIASANLLSPDHVCTFFSCQFVEMSPHAHILFPLNWPHIVFAQRWCRSPELAEPKEGARIEPLHSSVDWLQHALWAKAISLRFLLVEMEGAISCLKVRGSPLGDAVVLRGTFFRQ
jgi:hypothetical protein